MKKRIIALVSVILVMIVLTSCTTANNGNSNQSPTSAPQTAGTATPQIVTTAVSIENFAFVPNVLNVKVGDTVTWTNNDSAAHTILVDSVTSNSFAQGGTYTYTFNKAGTFSYSCSIHPSMTGTIVVK